MRRLVLIAALVGFGASLTSTVVHYRLLREPGYSSFCDVSSTVNCTQVYLSRYGSIAGVPVALVGTVWFGLVVILAAAARDGRKRTPFQENVPAYLFALSTLALALSMYLAYVSFFVLRAVCPMCVTTYAAVIALFVLSGVATSFPMSRLPGRALRDLKGLGASPAALGVSIVFLLGAGLAVAFFPREATTTAAAATTTPVPAASQSEQSEFERWYSSQPRVQVPVPADGATVLVVKFNDYQCPPCRQTYLEYQPVFKKFEATHPGAVRFVTRDYPLDPECNANAPGGVHLAACEAAVAVRLARRQGKGEELERYIFSNQDSLTPAFVKQAARDVGGVTTFDAEYAKTLNEVKADTALGGLLGVRGTPTFFLNGTRVGSALAPQFFEAAIAYELKKAGK
jgi:uncharacterized membrane protein/protein-disulfide isomerase